ncbi:substrate-binding domain-containing protein [Arthrobacter alpinus]|uniref:substrate-binding domain-containing protein n=1 Tax=Arthrobacter alpinus TaxID=656366 RepID=UPI001646BDFE|nr:substrate-binding domain-containing protein [Arthrobacter alpinus]
MPSDTVRGALIIVGSGSQQAEIKAWQEAWVGENNGVSVNFSPDGQDVGLEALFSDNTYVATSDTPLTRAETPVSSDTCGPERAFSIPTSISPVGVVYNLSGRSGLKLDAPTLSGIYSGSIKKWNDPKLLVLNPTLDLPAKDIVPVTSGSHSAMTFASSSYLSGNSGQLWPASGSFTWPGDVAGKKVDSDKDIAKEVDDTFGSIAFLGSADIGNRFATASLEFNGEFVSPTTEQIKIAIANSEVTVTSEGVSVDMVSQTGQGYPLASVRYQVFCSRYKNKPTATLVKSWASFVVSEPGQTKVWVALGSFSPNQQALSASRKLAASIDYNR